MIDLFIKGSIGLLAILMAAMLWRAQQSRHVEFRQANRYAMYGAVAIVLAKCVDVAAILAALRGFPGRDLLLLAQRGASAIVVAGLLSFLASVACWVRAGDRLRSQKDSVVAHSHRLETVFENSNLALSAVPAILYRSTGPINRENMKCEFLNDRIEDILGYSRERMENDPGMLFGLMHPDDRKRYDAGEGLAIMSQPKTVVEHRFRHRNGEYRWIRRHMRRVLDENGEFKELIGCGFDISDLKAAEKRLSDFLDSSPDAVITIDKHHTVVFASTRATSLFGYSKEQLIGRSIIELVSDDDVANAHDGSLRSALESYDEGEGADIELYGRRKDGSAFPAEVRISAIRGGGYSLAALAFRDISARKETEAKLLQAQKMEAVGQLTGGIAHDFNNMLTVVIGNLQMLDTSKLGDRSRELLEAAVSGAERASDLTDRLLAFSRQQVLSPADVDISALLGGLEPLLHRVLGDEKSLRVQIDDDIWSIRVDAAQLENSILNLVINARDALAAGGELAISASNRPVRDNGNADHDEISAGDYVQLTISDNGGGIAEGDLPHIFDPFFTTKDVGKGSGLGLSMVHGFVKQSNGHITVRSEPGAGTTFDILLKRSGSDANDSTSAGPSEQDAPEGRERILLVEDNHAVRQIASDLLKSLHYEVLEADCAAGAMKVLDLEPDVDLLFTDLMMPGGVTGIELARQVLERNPNLKVLYTTGYASSAIADGALANPHHLVLDKPYRRSELAHTVRHALDRE